jgi:hypothetical protein|uniref:FAD-dependent oxidoreductase n=1 Tax=Prosthecobacter sp. TaxID=1965333 RepID=UPI0037843C15
MKLVFIILFVIATMPTIQAANPVAAAKATLPDFSPKAEYADDRRMHQGIPSIERAKNGRLWAAWYGGGLGEDQHNFVMLATSGDDGLSWSKLKLVIDPDGSGPVRAFDPCLWHDPQGRLWLFWSQKDPASMHNFAIMTEDALVENPVWSQPRYLSKGVMLNKPTVLTSGEWLMPTCIWRDEHSSRILRSTDQGATFTEFGSATIPKYEDRNGDENMIVERKDGSLWMLVRTGYGLGESFSKDRGKSWTDVATSGIQHAESRFFIRRLASGRLLMVRHAGTVRSHLTAYLSEDDGRTWGKGLLIDERGGVSYPDAIEGPPGEIRLIYDYNRKTLEKQVLMTVFHEDDVLRGSFSEKARHRVIVNQATGRNPITQPYDVAVFGATPSGIAAAIAAKRAGLAHVTLVDPSAHVGGRFAETIGFGEIDRMKPESVGGLWTELRVKVDAHYGKKTATPEPHIMEQILSEWLKAEGVVFADRFQPVRAEKKGAHLVRIFSDYRGRIEAPVFIDATYYGDLLPLAGVSFTIGRESRAQYGESLAGVLLKLENPPGPIDLPIMSSPISGLAADGKTLLPHVQGLTTDVREGDGDKHLQCANLYACLTKDPAKRVELTVPPNYDPAEFELLRREIARLGKDAKFGFGGGVPGQKTKMNDGVNYLLHWGLAGGADAYPAATPKERRQIWETHRGYTHRMLWFLRTDPSVPESIRQNLQQWGLPKDEFTDNGHWPYDLYAREGRRMISDFVMTQRDLFADFTKPDAIALGSFPVDSHVVRRLASPDGKEVINEGGYLVIPPIYQIPYRALAPKASECDNLLVTCALSSSRVAFNSLRVEPTWMMLGQAAGTAAAMTQKDKTTVQRVNASELQRRLREAAVPFQKP